MKRILNHIKDFYIIWIIIGALIFVAHMNLYGKDWGLIELAFWVILGLCFVYLVARPMGLVYGLIGTSGAIRVFFINFVLISGIFASVYYCGFFRDAGISYDVNQPHIVFDMFADSNAKDTTITIFDSTTIISEYSNSKRDTVAQIVPVTLHYQRVSLQNVIQNTVMTSLMQEPSDFFAISSTYNEGMMAQNIGNEIDMRKTYVFHWILIFQILISWIFFGVFISILYNKFRYES